LSNNLQLICSIASVCFFGLASAIGVLILADRTRRSRLLSFAKNSEELGRGANSSVEPSPRYWAPVVSRYAADIQAYWREAVSLLDFFKVMQVRMALSKVGRLICPSPIVAKLHLRSFGSEPIYLRSHTTDISVLNELIVTGGYDALIRHPQTSPRLIVDLGANTGLVARWIMNRYPDAAVLAVEPEPGNAETLCSNTSRSDVIVTRAAIGAFARTIRIHTTCGEHGFTMVGEPALGATSFEVPVVTMASILPKTGDIDLLKVDIEGAEEELFDDCSSWIHRVQRLLVECHGAYKLSHLIEALRKAGATFRLIEDDLKPEWGFEVGLLERVHP
jgi:FkbM family methyltransferase